jgi:hypothetical protein
VYLTPEQRRRRQRFEQLLRLAAPFLDALLWVGDKVSRLSEPEDVEYYPPQPQDDPKVTPLRPRRPRSRTRLA